MGPFLRSVLLPACLSLTLAPASAVHAAETAVQPPELRAGARSEIVGLPLTISSQEGAETLSAEVEGSLSIPFEQVAPVLTDPSAWCDIVPLSYNIKACTWREEATGTVLSFYLGLKRYQAPEAATRCDYRFVVAEASRESLRVTLQADEGPLGIRDSRIVLDAAPSGAGTSLRMVSSYRPSLRSQLLTDGYLATAGRQKVGFTVVDTGPGGPEYIGGIRGVVERNAMRYYLALRAYFETRRLPESERFEARLRAWLAQIEAYRRQLYELEKEEYLAVKRRERLDQMRLQQGIDTERGGEGRGTQR